MWPPRSWQACALDDVWVYHPDTLLWLKPEVSGSFPARSAHVAVGCGRYVVVHG